MIDRGDTVRFGSSSSGRSRENLARPLETRESLRELGPDRDDLEDRSHEEAEEDRVREEAAQRERSREDLTRADEHDDGADDPEEDRRGEAHDARRGQRLEHVVEEALDAGRERLLLALLGVVALHDAHASERLGEAAGDLRVELRALAEDRPDRSERLVQDDAEARRGRRMP